MRSPLFALIPLLGLPLGVGAFTFVYAKGFSYLSTEPSACVNCHVMQPQYDAWMKSGHRHAAVCVACHLPAHGLAKWIAKADQGFRHSLAFTLQNFHEPIAITAADRVIVADNCRYCHADMVHAIAFGSERDTEPNDCLHCHADAGHR